VFKKIPYIKGAQTIKKYFNTEFTEIITVLFIWSSFVIVVSQT